MPDDQIYGKNDKQDHRQSTQNPWKDLCESKRITDLPFYVMRNEGRCIDRHGLDFEPHRFKDKGVGNPAFRQSADCNLRQFIDTFLK